MNRTKGHLLKNLNKQTLSQKYYQFLKNPKIQKITKVNPDEYNQHLRYLQQLFNIKKKEFENQLKELKKSKPEKIMQDVFTKNKSLIDRLNLERIKYKLNEKLDDFSYNLRNLCDRSKHFNKFSVYSKEKLDFLRSKSKENFRVNRDNKIYEKINSNDYFNIMKEKALFVKNYIKETIKNTTYMYILYFVSFIFFIKVLKFSFNELSGNKNSYDENYEQISNKLNELERQNEELIIINKRLFESKYS